MIALENLTLGFKSRTLIKDVSVTFSSGELIALIGRNGAGKSTLLKTIIGQQTPQDGDILVNGESIRSISAEKLSRTVSFVSTERTRIANLTCEDLVSIGRSPYTNWIGKMQKEDMDIVYKSLEAVGMSSYAKRSCDTLSDGENQKIMIARALAQTTPVIILDEPTAFLDIPTRFDLCRLLRRLAHEEHKCIIFSTHDTDSAIDSCDFFAIISNSAIEKIPTAEAVEKINQMFKL